MKETASPMLGPSALLIQVGQNQSLELCPRAGPQQPRNVQGTASTAPGSRANSCRMLGHVMSWIRMHAMLWMHTCAILGHTCVML